MSMHACCRFSLTLCDLWTVTLQAPLSMGFSRQEYWSGLPCPPPGDLPKTEIKPSSLMSPALDSLPLVPPGKPTKEMVLSSKTKRGFFENTLIWFFHKFLSNLLIVLNSPIWNSFLIIILVIYFDWHKNHLLSLIIIAKKLLKKQKKIYNNYWRIII